MNISWWLVAICISNWVLLCFMHNNLRLGQLDQIQEERPGGWWGFFLFSFFFWY
jgi:hypothetical protein